MFPTHQEKKYPLELGKVTSGRVLICAFGDDSGPNWLITVVSVSYANEMVLVTPMSSACAVSYIYNNGNVFALSHPHILTQPPDVANFKFQLR